MAERSLQASQKGIQLAKQALTSKRLFQKDLIGLVCQSRQPISKFFTGKPVDREIFVGICERLSLKWQDIAELPPVDELTKVEDKTLNINTLLKEVREKIKPLIEEDCGTMRVLDMTHPIGLNDIYTNVNILEKITGRRRLGIEELLQQCTSDDFNHFGLVKNTEKKLPGLEAVEKYSKLMILGKPGAGKTTFLKYLAIQCIKGEFQAKRIPIFVTLKHFAEAINKPGLLEYITEHTRYRVCQTLPLEKKEFIASIHYLIAHGKALLLLDGLDEVREEDSMRVLREIRDFSKLFQKNNLVMTCRIAAREYTFENFTEVEVADFDDEQITTFAINWFKSKAIKPEIFIQRLKQNSRIKQLAVSPLLLTLLCIGFEESGDFPANLSELYKEGLDALLKKWDAKRGIERYQIYKKLSVQRKEDLLSKIALTTFERGDYFFKQKAAEQYIIEYIRNLPNANTDEEALQLDSEKVLTSIEAQHGLLVERAKGIYSFSHLTFHEYFTAREFIIGQSSSEEALQSLVSHITEKRWREVFLLAIGMSPSADRLLLLMKEKIDSFLASAVNLQNFLKLVHKKSLAVNFSANLQLVRDFYFAFLLGSNLVFRDKFIGIDIEIFLISNLIGKAITNHDNKDYFQCNFVMSPQIQSYFKLPTSRFHHERYEDDSRQLIYSFMPNIKLVLLPLIKQLPNQKSVNCNKWWKNNGENWIGELRKVMAEYRYINIGWKLKNSEIDLLNQYYHANVFLIDCLNSDCYVSREVRQYIEDTLLLPIEEMNKYQQQS